VDTSPSSAAQFIVVGIRQCGAKHWALAALTASLAMTSLNLARMLHKSAVVPPRNRIAEFFDFQAKAPLPRLLG